MPRRPPKVRPTSCPRAVAHPFLRCGRPRVESRLSRVRPRRRTRAPWKRWCGPHNASSGCLRSRRPGTDQTWCRGLVAKFFAHGCRAAIFRGAFRVSRRGVDLRTCRASWMARCRARRHGAHSHVLTNGSTGAIEACSVRSRKIAGFIAVRAPSRSAVHCRLVAHPVRFAAVDWSPANSVRGGTRTSEPGRPRGSELKKR